MTSKPEPEPEPEPNLQTLYDANATAYSQFQTTPLGTLEQQLFDLSITNCSGLRVLDLGGGTGLRARDALKAGAEAVDVVDISPAMMRLGQDYEASIGRDRITWHHADVSKPLDHLFLSPALRHDSSSQLSSPVLSSSLLSSSSSSSRPPSSPQPYDMVIANGIFDHAHDVAELEAMWRNAAAYLKPGGRLVANRNNPFSRAARHPGKYGVVFTDFRPFPGGVAFRYKMATEPPLVFDSIALDAYYAGSLEVPGKFFAEFRNVPWEETSVVKADPEFWSEYLEDPILFIFTARKLET